MRARRTLVPSTVSTAVPATPEVVAPSGAAQGYSGPGGGEGGASDGGVERGDGDVTGGTREARRAATSGGDPPRRADRAASLAAAPRAYAVAQPPVRAPASARVRGEVVAPPRLYGDGTEVASRDHRHLGDGEMEARRTVVRQYVALGVSADQLPGVMADQGWPMSRVVARSEYDAVLGEWASDHQHLRETTRVAQVRRLEGDLVRYRAAEVAALDAKGGERGAGRTRWQAVVQTEALLARIQGHMAPTQVEVKVAAVVVVREALVEVVASLSEEDLERLLAEEDELEALAAVGRRYGTVDAVGVPVVEGAE